MNVLYDKNHYKLALGQISIAKNLIDNVAKDYGRMMKFADSLYRCKCLKRAALGRWERTNVNHFPNSIFSLSEWRPSWNVKLRVYNTSNKSVNISHVCHRSILTLEHCSFAVTQTSVNQVSWIKSHEPMSKCNRMRSRRSLSTSVIRITNISDGKSSILRVFSIIHSVGKAKNVRKENEFAVFRCLEDRNTIEMQAITALAHLRAAILYVMDLSETCGYTLEEQVERFDRFIRNHIVVLLV